MSLLEPLFAQATALGLDVQAPVTPAGMAFILAKCESYGCLRVNTGMAEDWHVALRVWAHQHKIGVFPLHIGIAAAVQHGLSGAHFTTPVELFRAVADYRKQQIRKALAGRKSPDIPAEIARQGVTAELAYRAAWAANAAATGDGTEADRLTRQDAGLPETEAELKTIEMPRDIAEKLQELTLRGNTK